jgi:hypothetical protein
MRIPPLTSGMRLSPTRTLPTSPHPQILELCDNRCGCGSRVRPCLRGPVINKLKKVEGRMPKRLSAPLSAQSLATRALGTTMCSFGLGVASHL